MILRNLKIEDSLRMLEWMHDKETTKYLQSSFSDKTLEDCIDFIRMSINDRSNFHKAVIDNNGDYVGTVSLKQIDYSDSIAEFAITMHPSGQGRNLASQAMKCLLEYGIKNLGLKEIFWCVNPSNRRAIHFYIKNGYKVVNQIPARLLAEYPDHPEYIWFKFPYDTEIKNSHEI